MSCLRGDGDSVHSLRTAVNQDTLFLLSAWSSPRYPCDIDVPFIVVEISWPATTTVFGSNSRVFQDEAKEVVLQQKTTIAHLSDESCTLAMFRRIFI